MKSSKKSLIAVFNHDNFLDLSHSRILEKTRKFI